MITQTLLNIIIGAVTFFLNAVFLVIPDFHMLDNVQNEMTSGISFVFGIANFMDPIIPSSVSISIITLYFTFYLVFFTFKFISWILRKIPALGLS